MGNPKDVKHDSSKTLKHDERIKIKKNNRTATITQKKEQQGKIKPRPLWRRDYAK